jgi:hypothetical protein
MNPSVINREKIINKFNLQNNIKEQPLISREFLKKNYPISLNILSRLPSTLSYNKECCKSYNFYNKNVLDTIVPNFITDKTIHICVYKIVNKPFNIPFILFLLYKNKRENYIFPNFKTSQTMVKTSDSKINLIYKYFKTKPNFIGYKETSHNIYLFYEDKEEFSLSYISRYDKWWWATIFEIMNPNKILNFDIDKLVYRIFFKEPLLYTLYKDNNKISLGTVVYFGASKNYISFIAAIGLPKESPTSNLGPFYYFYNYIGAGRFAIWSKSRKEETYNNKLITRDQYGVLKRGGLVRFILFGNTPKFFLNREDDLEDQSTVSQELAKNSTFFKKTLKIRDVNGNWANNLDIAYIGSTIISGSDDGKIPARRLYTQWVAKDYYQYASLSYHYINTDIFTNITDSDAALSAPYELTNFYIE